MLVASAEMLGLLITDAPMSNGLFPDADADAAVFAVVTGGIGAREPGKMDFWFVIDAAGPKVNDIAGVVVAVVSPLLLVLFAFNFLPVVSNDEDVGKEEEDDMDVTFCVVVLFSFPFSTMPSAGFCFCCTVVISEFVCMVIFPVAMLPVCVFFGEKKTSKTRVLVFLRSIGLLFKNSIPLTLSVPIISSTW